MAYASSTSLGVRLTEGEGNLPKLVLTSPAGRCVICYKAIFPLTITTTTM